MSLGLSDRLRKIASASFLASGSPALANQSGAHSATRSYRVRSASLLLLGLFLGGLLPPGLPRARAEAPPEGWHLVLLDGQPAGYTHESERELAGGATLSMTRQKLVVRRAAQAVELEMAFEIEEERSGQVTRLRTAQRLARNETVTTGVVRGDRLELTSGEGGNNRKSEVAFDRRTIGPRALERLLREKLLKEGDTATAVQFFPEKNGCGTLTVTRGAEEEVRFPAGSRRLVRRTSRAEILPGVDVVEWIDGEGRVWKSATRLLGMSIETYRSTAAEVLSQKFASPPEIFYSSSIRPDRPLRDATGAREVVYRFRLKEGDFASRGLERVFRGTGQTVLREEGRAARVVRIGRVAPGAAVRRPETPTADLKEYLEPNSFIQSDDPLVMRLSEEAVGGETDALVAARKIEAWIRANVRFKDLKTAFASAKEVAETREGDCTEHGVLLAALARAAGIPARVVSGFVYYEGSFVGHLWTEVWIDRWIPLDGTRGRGEVGPDHIGLTASSLAVSSAADLFLELAQVVGNLSIQVLEEK